MFRSRCAVAGGALILSTLLVGQPAVSQDRVPGPAALDSADVTRERGRQRDRRGDDRFVPPSPLFDEFGGERLGAEDEFLDGGGGISTEPDVYFTDDREEFLEDGGGISTGPDVYFTDDREEFLEDGGGISAPGRTLRTLKFRRRDRGWRDPYPSRSTHRTHGSFTVVYSDLGDRRHLPILPASLNLGAAGLAEGPKIIDVASESLDRRPIPASGIEVIYAGGSKIIRIAQDYDRAATDAISPSASQPSNALEPWSPGWMAWCSRTHASFDPDLGTYRAADGRRRFCTGSD
ncbi:hypothetical protein GTW51_02805 [Aurantimonas aggregata]|uniref:Lectin-like protein BA14k n=1 Tax=Aurantimonas aggregata TaxID=2047720 RepID=A0A6L9MCS9_9HYPH|nr:BA14K family protein [Aurantimonas aggregata]NDV85623.1 hypothetical protein [Aurantimonas aggregata]